MTFFLVIDLVLRIFPFFSHIFRMFTMLNVVYDHFLTRKPPFFTLFILSRTSNNTTSQNIGEDQCMGRPHLKFWGDRPPQSPLGLRPCLFLHSTRSHFKSVFSPFFSLFISILLSSPFFFFPPENFFFPFPARGRNAGGGGAPPPWFGRGGRREGRRGVVG